MLAQQRLANGQGIERRHIGADRQAIDRRRGDEGQIAHAGKRQLQGARDRRRRKREDVHIGFEAFQSFLMGDAEMLLFVDDQ